MHVFESSFRRHLVVEQRRAVLKALADRIGPGVTMGDVLDAADGLGWSDPMGDLTLADLAGALLKPGPQIAEPEPEDAAPEDDLEDWLDSERDEELDAQQEVEAAPEPAAPPAKQPKKPKASSRTKASRLKALRAKVDAEDRMSLEEAAELLVPIVEELGQATMQDLEDFTGIGRRKLRFHIGQLVRHEQLARHGMGRGTFYTSSE